MIPETPIPHVRGKTLLINGLVKRRGKLENLTDDTLKFAISDEDTQLAIITKTTGGGISQTSNGTYMIEVPATELETLDLPKDRYWFEVEMTEPSGRRWVVARGPVILYPSPFA
ncbi:hypothetical protein [Nitrolancea hollandica]|uniref:Uncharacterized protein n=1 Tax=Nitrolancea hollandica Lb TaxID=1129897 RepID=I4EL38_9BACT|nr:hypothetical protein [Nitrolancea hollandica]CCF85400.1 hypothetical protein NITHO_4920011 [Nitrolancea hollandica Lb]